jgi:hypothetical protein
MAWGHVHVRSILEEKLWSSCGAVHLGCPLHDPNMVFVIYLVRNGGTLPTYVPR